MKANELYTLCLVGAAVVQRGCREAPGATDSGVRPQWPTLLQHGVQLCADVSGTPLNSGRAEVHLDHTDAYELQMMEWWSQRRREFWKLKKSLRKPVLFGMSLYRDFSDWKFKCFTNLENINILVFSRINLMTPAWSCHKQSKLCYISTKAPTWDLGQYRSVWTWTDR